jgi:hypothetical protein
MALVSSAKTEPQQHVIEPSPVLPMTLAFSFRASHSQLELDGSTCPLSFAFRSDAVRDLRSTGRHPTRTLTARPTVPHDQLPCVRTKNLQENLWTIQRLPALRTFPSRKPATVWCQRRKPWFSSQSASANSTISCWVLGVLRASFCSRQAQRKASAVSGFSRVVRGTRSSP